MSEEYGLKFVVNGEDYDKIKKSLNEQIEDLQQKVKQLENENKYLKMSNPEQNMEHFRIVNENKRKIDMLRKENHQLENIRKEAIGYIKSVYIPELQEGHICINYKETDYLLNILNKGDNNGK